MIGRYSYSGYKISHFLRALATYIFDISNIRLFKIFL